MNDFLYILEPYNGMNTRFHCPNCNQKNKTFVRYINSETTEYVHPSVGRCNSESFCGYHYTPKQYFLDNNISIPEQSANSNKIIRKIPPHSKLYSNIPISIFEESLVDYNENNFISFLNSIFGSDITSQLITKYFIGTSNHWKGSTIFWQVDGKGKIRTGKIMLYNPSNGHRVKEPYNHISWIHKTYKLPDYELKQCFFGEHLLHDNTKPVAIVESEKTAIIASVYLPQFIWLAVGSLTNLNTERCKVLRNRQISLFPDLKGYDKWCDRAYELSNIALFNVSDLLELKANVNERNQGFDLADYLLKFNHKDFILPDPVPEPVIKPVIQLYPIEPFKEQLESFFEFPEYNSPKSESWDNQIQDLESFFKEIKIPNHSIKLNPYTTIIDVDLFLKSHFILVKANNGNKTFYPVLLRLQELKQILIDKR